MMGLPGKKNGSEKKGDAPYPFYRLKPGWRGNLAIFGLLGMLIITYFYWQIRLAEKTFTDHVNEHARMVAGLIQLNAKGAVASQNVVEEIISTFLGNSARFIDYLDAVAPFSEMELTAFASETGLSGIRILEKGGEYREGPSQWLSLDKHRGMADNPRFSHLTKKSLYCYSLPRPENMGTVLVGLTDVRIEAFQRQIGLLHLLEMLPGTGGIRYIRMEKPASPSPGSITEPIIRIYAKKADKIAEARLSLGDDILVIGMDAKQFLIRVDQLWKEFIVFSTILILSGVFFSWLLLRNQRAYLNEVQNFERRLAKETEDASLGRASASITHEIRNPLNAISMGLQRLQLEGDELNEEHRELVANLLKAVKRTDGIISGLRRFAGPVKPLLTRVYPDSVIRHILLLYKEEYSKRGITVEYRPDYTGTVSADLALLEEAMENLIKNAIEAQPDGGDIFLGLSRKENAIVISIANNGFSLSEDDTKKILQPYFTTKTRGSGLGLAIVSRIIRGHGGHLKIQVKKPGRLKIDLSIPVNAHGSGVELNLLKPSSVLPQPIITGEDHENTCS
ncbi:MAG: GHKL domain-containing protein [Desulfobacterium sp.]|nr:GHKL domain-containing protein [Desulfobacterium sp.]